MLAPQYTRVLLSDVPCRLAIQHTCTSRTRRTRTPHCMLWRPHTHTGACAAQNEGIDSRRDDVQSLRTSRPRSCARSSSTRLAARRQSRLARPRQRTVEESREAEHQVRLLRVVLEGLRAVSCPSVRPHCDLGLPDRILMGVSGVCERRESVKCWGGVKRTSAS